jgi:hypothetical protein
LGLESHVDCEIYIGVFNKIIREQKVDIANHLQISGKASTSMKTRLKYAIHQLQDSAGQFYFTDLVAYDDMTYTYTICALINYFIARDYIINQTDPAYDSSVLTSVFEELAATLTPLSTVASTVSKALR